MQRFWAISAVLVAALTIAAFSLGQWFEHGRLIAERLLDPNKAVQDLEAAIVEDIRSTLSAQSGSELSATLLSPFAIRWITDSTVHDQTQLLGDYAPPDLAQFVPMRRSDGINVSYGILLRSLVLQESRKASADEETTMLLDNFLKSEHGGHDHQKSRATPATANSSIDRLLKRLQARFGKRPQFFELLKVLNDFELTEEGAQEISLAETKGPTSRSMRLTKTGLFSIEASNQDGSSTAISFSGTVLGPSYQYATFVRPSWFRLDILRYAKRVSVGNPDYDLFFGPNGCLSRIPLGVIVSKLESIEIDTSSRVQIEKLVYGSQGFHLEGQHLSFWLPASKQSNSTSLLSFEMYPVEKETVVAVISERI